MSLTEILVRLIGAVLAIVGLLLLLSLVGIGLGLGVALEPGWAAFILGVFFFGAGIYIIRGGTVTI